MKPRDSTGDSSPGDASRRTPVVLIADDDAGTRGMLAEILRLHGMDTIEAGDGQQAVLMAFERRPDVIILDIVMPNMDGIEAARAISADRDTTGTAMIAVSGMLSAELRREALDAGCVAYMQKPLAPMALVTEVRRWLSHNRANTSPGR